MSRIEGRVFARTPSTSRDGFEDVSVLLEQAEAVDERAELLHQRVGEVLVIEVSASLAAAAKVGDLMQGHVMVVGPGKIAAAPEAVPTGGEFVITSGPELDQPPAE